jgi:hypothetical protein
MIKKRDIILAACLIAVGIILFIVMRATMQAGSVAVVYVNGEKLQEYSLSIDGTYSLEGDYGKNVLVIKESSAYMEDADCPDKLCIKMGGISGNGETIVCLPHKLVVQIENGEVGEYDGKTY